MKQVQLISIFIMSGLVSIGQRVSVNLKTYKEVQVGEMCPDLELNNFINYSKSSARISDFKGKLLILDFWATWCGPCIGAFPKLDSLQKKFSGKLQILAITKEPENVVRFFYDKWPMSKGSLPPIVTSE